MVVGWVGCGLGVCGFGWAVLVGCRVSYPGPGFPMFLMMFVIICRTITTKPYAPRVYKLKVYKVNVAKCVFLFLS